MLKLPRDREIAAIVPVYGERGDCTCLHLRDGRECLLPVQMKTVLRLLAAEELDVAPELVDVLLSDTDLTPDGGPTTASRQTFVTGNAGLHAAKAFKQAVQSVLAEKYDCEPEAVQVTGGGVNVCGRKMSFSEVHADFLAVGREPKLTYTYTAPTTNPLGTPGDMHFAFSFAAQAAQVEIDTRTGEIRVVREESLDHVALTRPWVTGSPSTANWTRAASCSCPTALAGRRTATW